MAASSSARAIWRTPSCVSVHETPEHPDLVIERDHPALEAAELSPEQDAHRRHRGERQEGEGGGGAHQQAVEPPGAGRGSRG